MRAWLNALRRRLWQLLIHRMVFGERTADGLSLPFTRISPSTCIEHEDKLMLADHVFIGHFNFIEASAGVRIDEGVQVTNFVSIVTHSSHASLRVMGRSYASGRHERVGLISGPIHIGAYSFIGPHSLIEAGSTLGKGCVVAAYSAVRGDFPDFSLIRGNPAERVGDTREADLALLEAHPELKEQYLAWAGSMPQEGA
jgi:acetyltransferase-like isoleucine patch superfamily enzyme